MKIQIQISIIAIVLAFLASTPVYSQSKSDAGSFQYNFPGKPYAIAMATSLTGAISTLSQTITYTSFKRPVTITEGGFLTTFTYNGLGDYELDIRPSGTKEKLYLGGDFYSAPAVFVKENTGNWNIYYICRDYLGSITHITNSSGSVIQELSYDAWGRLRNPTNQSAYSQGAEPEPFLGRGYTGHEHLTRFGLINMNARLYDPALGRFLSPDPFVQMPDFSQSYNRYSYALNNPMRYTDPSGEKTQWWQWLVGDILTGGMVSFTAASAGAQILADVSVAATSGLIDGGWNEADRRANNSWIIGKGLFQADEDKSSSSEFWQIISRFTWEQPFSTFGYTTANIYNDISRAKVDYFHGATVMQTDLMKGTAGVTIGSNIMISRSDNIDYNNTTLLHEYGHYRQVRQWGGVPMLSMSLFSLGSAWFGWRSAATHQETWSEMDANVRSLSYFRGRLDNTQIDDFLQDNNVGHYYDGRFYRSYIFPGLLSYLIYDIIWSD
jgi:RHS repeat-associated protein